MRLESDIDNNSTGGSSMKLVCLDLEGVLVPEIWIGLAEKTGIDALKVTTRDVADYDELMRFRLSELDKAGLGLPDIQAVIQTLRPLEGAAAFLSDLRQDYQLIILSDTFYEFAMPLMAQLNYPALFCHKLEVNATGKITQYCLRQPDQKRHAVKAFKALNYTVLAAGDSLNDLGMLEEADLGLFFHAPDSVKAKYPQYEAIDDYAVLRAKLDAFVS